MTSVRTDFAALSPDVDPSQASHHLRVLHGDSSGFISLVLLGAERRERHSFFEWTEALPVGYDASRQGLQECVDARWNVYVACSTYNQVPAKGRGNRGDVLEVPGVWCDLDVKPGTEGYFQTEAELLEYTGRLPTPTLEVASGSGGRHLYWLTNERLGAKPGQDLLHAWLDYLRYWSGGRTIENVQDTTRILRLAGTIRWPKIENDVIDAPRPVELIREGPRYHGEELVTMSEDAHLEAEETRRNVRTLLQQRDDERRSDLQGQGLRLEIYDGLVREFNRLQDWEYMLTSTGWTLVSDDRAGVARCRYWARPGKSALDGKSASTDFVHNEGGVSNVMSIYSNDSSVADLWMNAGTTDMHGICTKWAYALTRLYGGDEEQLIRDAVAGRGRLT
jgi:hypothetical protein